MKETKTLRSSYFNLYKGIKEWHEKLQRHNSKDRIAKNPTGRYRVWDLPPGVPALANYPIQSTSAEITKYSLSLLYWALRKFGKYANILITVHDEIIVECIKSISEEVGLILQHCMVAGGEEFLKTCPVKADYSIGTDWSEK
jgi:DNA polymerase-1